MGLYNPYSGGSTSRGSGGLYNPYSSTSKTTKKKNEEPRSWFKVALDTASTAFDVGTTGVKYGLEELTGIDFYKTGDLKKAATQGKTGIKAESWIDTLNRVNPKGKGAVNNIGGFFAEVVLDPSSWLSFGTSAFVKTGFKASKTASLVSKASKTGKVQDAAKALESLGNAKDVSMATRSAVKTAKAMNTFDKIYGTTLIASGIEDLASGRDMSEVGAGLFQTGLGLLGYKGASVSNKTLEKLMDIPNDKNFVENATNLVTGSLEKNTPVVKAVTSKKMASVDYSMEKEDLLGNFIYNKINKMPDKETFYKRAANEFFNLFDSGKPLSQEVIDVFGDKNGELYKKILGMKIKSTKDQVMAGKLKSTLDDTQYIQKTLETTTGKPLSAEQRAMIQSNSTLKDLTESLSAYKGHKMKRKYANADEFDNAMAERGLDIRVKRDGFFEGVLAQVNRGQKARETYNFNTSLIREAKKRGQQFWDIDATKKFKVDLFTKKSDEISKLVSDRTTQKILNKEDYNTTKNNVKEAFKKQIEEIKNEGTGSIEELTTSFKKISSVLYDDLLTSNKGVNEAIANKIELEKMKFDQEWKDYITGLNIKRGQLEDKGLLSLSEASFQLKDQSLITKYPGLRGVTLPIGEWESLKNIGEAPTTKGAMANVESFWMHLKNAITVSDLFQYPQVIRSLISTGAASVGTDTKGALSSIGKTFSESKNLNILTKEYKQRVLRATRDGVELKKSSDLGARIKFKELVDDKDLTYIDKKIKWLGETADSIPVIKQLKKVIKFNDDFAFDVFTPNAKLNTYEQMSNVFRKQGIPDELARRQAADFVNNAFAAQNWELLMAKNPQITKGAIRTARIATFAPDYLTSQALRMAGLARGGMFAKASAIELFTGITTGLVLTNLAQYYYNGKFTYENREGNWYSLELDIKDQKGNPVAVNIMGNWSEPLKVLNSPGSYAKGKASSLVSSIFKDIVQGYNPEMKAPIPFFIQPTIGAGITALEEKAGIKRKDKFGKTKGMEEALKLSLLEFLGTQTTYRGEKSSSVNIASYAKEKQKVQDWFLGLKNQ